MKFLHLSIIFSTLFFIQPASSETIIIQDCDDITLGNSAYANDGWIEQFERPDSDTLVIDLWKC